VRTEIDFALINFINIVKAILMKDNQDQQPTKRTWTTPDVIIMRKDDIQSGRRNSYHEGGFFGPNHSDVHTQGGVASHVSGYFDNYVS